MNRNPALIHILFQHKISQIASQFHLNTRMQVHQKMNNSIARHRNLQQEVFHSDFSKCHKIDTELFEKNVQRQIEAFCNVFSPLKRHQKICSFVKYKVQNTGKARKKEDLRDFLRTSKKFSEQTYRKITPLAISAKGGTVRSQRGEHRKNCAGGICGTGSRPRAALVKRPFPSKNLNF